jgi:indole-3-glycerol phosphate synthase
MATILDNIIAAKRAEVTRKKERVPLETLKERIATQPTSLAFADALRGDRVRLIAEAKKASPSRGLLRPDFDPVTLATTYAENGAAAVSVLTDSHFQGTLEHMAAVKEALLVRHVPVLRKDFILEPYQVYESRAWNADAILLIVAILEPRQLSQLLGLARELSLGCLVEVHNEEELDAALQANSEVIGINNRDLHTFKTDLSVTERLAPRITPNKTLVSESGIHTPKDVARVCRAGVYAVLVGEALVTASDVAAKVRELASIKAERSPT